MSGKRKVLIGGIVVLVLGGAAAILAGRGESGAEVRMAEVRERDLVSTVTATGSVRARRSVDISADIQGRVTRLFVEEGDPVEVGDTLLHIDPTQYRAAVARAQANLSQARSRVAQERANLARAERELGRMRELRREDRELVSLRDLEDAETEVEVSHSLLASAEHGVEQAEADLEEARDRLDKTTIRAPMAGTVTRLDIEEGETAIVGTMNNPGSLLLTVGDLGFIEAVMTVAETDIPRVSLQDSAAVRIDAYRGDRIGGVVTKIGNSAVQAPQGGGPGTATVEYEVILALEDSPILLRPDLSATADIITDVRRDALAVPIIAVTARDPDALPDPASPEEDEPLEGEEPPEDTEDPSPPAVAGSSTGITSLLDEVDEPVEGVFVVRDGAARFTPIEIGITGREHFEVLSGLSAGDTVVSGPYQTIRDLRDGTAVRPLADGS